MTKPNKPYDTTQRAETLVSRDFALILDSKYYDQAQQTLWYHTTPSP